MGLRIPLALVPVLHHAVVLPPSFARYLLSGLPLLPMIFTNSLSFLCPLFQGRRGRQILHFGVCSNSSVLSIRAHMISMGLTLRRDAALSPHQLRNFRLVLQRLSLRDQLSVRSPSLYFFVARKH